MPIVPSTFLPPRWLAPGHVQTILPTLWPRRFPERFTREVLELGDGDFLELAWLRHGPPARLAILLHGLEGDAAAGYIRGLAHCLHAAGWDVLAWSFRGCGALPNRLARSYHSGETGDLRAVVEHAARSYPRIALAGFSLGGNVVLKYLGEAPPPAAVRAGVAVSAPVDLASTAAALDAGGVNWIYRQRFLATLLRKMAEKARRFPGEVRAVDLARLRTFRQFDDRFTAPLHGFRDAADYWARASSRPLLGALRVPTLLLNARNDPLLREASFPFAEAEQNPCFYLEAPASGGHVGFLDRRTGRAWLERRVTEFLNEHVPA